MIETFWEVTNRPNKWSHYRDVEQTNAKPPLIHQQCLMVSSTTLYSSAMPYGFQHHLIFISNALWFPAPPYIHQQCLMVSSTTLYFIASSYNLGFFLYFWPPFYWQNTCFLIANQDKWNMNPVISKIRGKLDRKAWNRQSLQRTQFSSFWLQLLAISGLMIFFSTTCECLVVKNPAKTSANKSHALTALSVSNTGPCWSN